MSPISNRKGMTLIEIMIVLAIIGGIAALLLPRLTGQLDKAKQKEARIQMSQIVNALSMYYTDCGKNPAALENLVTQDANCSNWGPEAYLKKSPKDPWGHDFVYELNGNEYNLKCLGKDGKEGGSGYDSDITLEDIQ
ncbi:type II secretion system major pseudopilin GspG [Bdellovibrio svalbardensis]|uniref:Type II secretion system core protein G n=1 Tax=Bdellovibrio svalbardensis TaxID=2972972 RepID=A0ABT6DKQ7_9BACT|nr:type II secretion system major pseudopilin GspG [Bdellovibrio svalbardensis]MDG0817440.1 type II secretion system major pseudopilin GspG [Bdellovibrio svalbardensis]